MFEELFRNSGLSLERLHALVQLGEEGTLIRAAKGEPGRQSRLSHHIKELSGYFGVELTERVGKQLRLTTAGEKLVQLARQQFEDLLRFKKDMQGNAQPFRLAAGDSLLQWRIIPAIASLQQNRDLRFVLHTLQTDEIIPRLKEQRLDFGLLPGNSDLKGLSKRAICKVHQIIVVPDRIGARSGMLTLKHALLDCPHVALVGDAALRQAIRQVAQTLGRDFEPQLECESISQCVAAVQTGRFAAVLPDWSWDSDCGLSHQVYDDAKLEGLEQKLVLAWNPRLLQTRGVGAKNAIESLTAQLAQDSAEESVEDLD